MVVLGSAEAGGPTFGSPNTFCRVQYFLSDRKETTRPFLNHQPTDTYFAMRRVVSFRSLSVVVLGLEPPLAVDGCHTTGAGGGDRLPVGVILAVATGEDLGKAG